jgi:hypothetical protein
VRACGCSVVGVSHVHVVGSDGSSWVGFQPVVRGENGCGVVELGETTGAGNTRWPLTQPVRSNRTEG